MKDTDIDVFSETEDIEEGTEATDGVENLPEEGTAEPTTGEGETSEEGTTQEEGNENNEDDVDGKTEDNEGTIGDGTTPLEEQDFDFTYKVQGEVKEFDDRLKSVVKTKEDADYVRDILERADGIHHIKEHRDRLKQEISGFETQLDEYKYKDELVKKLVEAGDPLGALKVIGLKEEDLIKATSILVSDEKEKNAYFDRSKGIQQQLEQERLLSMKERELEQVHLENSANQLRSLLSVQEVQNIAGEYDNIFGKKDAFIDKIVETGNYLDAVAKTKPQYIPPSVEQVFSIVYGEAKTMVERLKPAGAANPAPQATNTTPQLRTKKQKAPTIPSSSGAISSKKPINIWED